jgi:hypothetical protein
MKQVLLLLLTVNATSLALPTMIRLGYPNCVSCHVAPQGGGLLNQYGRGIDEAQSLRAGEYQPGSWGKLDFLTLGGRVDQDLRVAGSSQLTTSSGGPLLGINRGRFFYRNVTNLSQRWRFSAIVDGETDPTLRKSKTYDPALRPGLVLVTSAMLQYRPREGFELSAGREALPQGLIIPDQTTFIKARNRFGYYDTPTQAKAFLWRKRWMVSPFVFAPSGRESGLARESGGGIVAEYDLLGKGKTVIGVNALRGSDRIGNRTVTGIYSRLGFGSWGVLAEHDITNRQLHQHFGAANFAQHASYIQGFRYFREWLLTSAIVERLSVERPFAEYLWAFKGEVSARLSSNMAVGFRAGVQRDYRTGTLSPTLSIQLAMKTVR